MLVASLSAKEKEVVVAAGENAAQDKLCPMRIAVVAKTVRVMVIVVSCDDAIVQVESGASAFITSIDIESSVEREA